MDERREGRREGARDVMERESVMGQTRLTIELETTVSLLNDDKTGWSSGSLSSSLRVSRWEGLVGEVERSCFVGLPKEDMPSSEADEPRPPKVEDELVDWYDDMIRRLAVGGEKVERRGESGLLVWRRSEMWMRGEMGRAD